MEVGQDGLPSGLVTFVYTDIEGSTRLFRRLGDRYPAVLDRHRELLDRSWHTYGGHPVDAEGDSALAAFGDASSAVAACAMAQRLLATEDWPGDAPLRVRMGVHTGLASPRGSGYVSLAVHRTARLAAAAHGGQVLVSTETADRDGAVPGVSLQAVGRYRLRDFDEPEGIYQVTAEDLPRGFPAVRAIPADNHNLVRIPTSFVGRERDCVRLRAALRPGAMVSVVGPGGVGKTRLAMEIGLSVATSWPDGVWLVDLTTVDSPVLVPSAVADAIGISDRSGDLTGEILRYLRERELLLLVDNCEHRTDAVAALLEAMAGNCPRVGVLATSREPLGLAGEVVHRLGPLTDPAVELFVERATAVRPDFPVDHGTLDVVASICSRLDGLPLAIEIAAARCSVLTPVEIQAGLGDRMRLLRSADRRLPERQRTLANLLDWSAKLLSADERSVLRGLAVFSGAFTVEAATAAAGSALAGSGPYEVPELVWSLCAKSLVVADLTANGTRYRLLETVREYALRQLTDAGELAGVAVRVGRWFTERVGPDLLLDRRWLDAVATDLDNLRALIPLVASEDQELAQRLVCVIGRFYDATSNYRTGLDELGDYADALLSPTSTRVAMLAAIGQLHLRFGDVPAAKRMVAYAAGLRPVVGVPAWDDVCVEKTAGEIEVRAGDPAAAARTAARALSGQLSVRGRARLSNLLGIARLASGDMPGAAEAFGAELAACRRLGDESFLANAHNNCAEVALRLGDVTGAAAHQLACLRLATVLGQPIMVAYTLLVTARLVTRSPSTRPSGGGMAYGAGDSRTAVELHAHGESILNGIGLALFAEDRRLSDEVLAALRAELGSAEFDRRWSAGQAEDLPVVIGRAEQLLADVAGSGRSATGPDPV